MFRILHDKEKPFCHLNKTLFVYNRKVLLNFPLSCDYDEQGTAF